MIATYEKKEPFGLSATKITNFRGFPEMFHPHCEIIMLTEGNLEISIDGVEYTMQKSDVCFVFPYSLHSYKDSPKASAYILLFDSSRTGSFEKLLYTHHPKSAVLALSEAEMLFKRFLQLYRENTSLSIKMANAYLQTIVGEILKGFVLEKQETKPKDTTRQVLNYCAENFNREDMNINTIAQALFISPSYLSKLFNRKLKTSFRQYINNLRISKARLLLAESDKSIVEVMLECGFGNQSSFNRIFFAHCSLTPREYRKLYFRHG